MKFLAVIPARYASTRFPGKPLADIAGKTMIERVYCAVRNVFSDVYIATDDRRIQNEAERFGGHAVMTSSDHRSGTDRCREALEKIEAATGERFDVVVNIQGDEPFISPMQLELIASLFDDPSTEIATLVKAFAPDEDIFNPNLPKVVFSTQGRALYFSRSAIPFIRGCEKEIWQQTHTFYKHIGLYAYRSDILKRITDLSPGTLEQCESLEQLRWIENGYSIKTAITDCESIAIDTPEDLERAKKWFEDSK